MKGFVVGRRQENALGPRIGFCLYEAGFAGLLILFPLLVMPFSQIAGIIIIVIEFIWVVVDIKTAGISFSLSRCLKDS
jgi:hypothetical protein